MGKSRRKSQGSGMSDSELRKYVICLIIVSVVLTVMAMVWIFGKREHGQTEAVTTETNAVMVESTSILPIEPDTKEYVHEFGGSILTKDSKPEINQLMEQYFRSISDCDMDTFMQLFSSQDTTQTESFRSQFENQRQYIEGYQNISCYVTEGMDQDSYVAYVYYETKFKEVETPAPAMVQVYAVKCQDGQYRIYDQEISPELEIYLSEVALNEDVRLLVSQVDRQMTDAMEADPEFGKLVAYLKSGQSSSQDETQGSGETLETEATDTEETNAE